MVQAEGRGFVDGVFWELLPDAGPVQLQGLVGREHPGGHQQLEAAALLVPGPRDHGIEKGARVVVPGGLFAIDRVVAELPQEHFLVLGGLL